MQGAASPKKENNSCEMHNSTIAMEKGIINAKSILVTKFYLCGKLTELVLLSSLRISVSMSTVDEHFLSPAARQRTATHWAIECKACFATPPDCGDGLARERSESSKVSKLVFAE